MIDARQPPVQTLAGQLKWFSLVGILAMAVHWLIAVCLVTVFLVEPLLSNVIAFMLAFIVSYGGHFHLSFSHCQSHRKALPKFALTAVLSFCLNETLLYYLIRETTFPFSLLLLTVLLLVAAFTFLMSRYWAFRAQG